MTTFQELPRSSGHCPFAILAGVYSARAWWLEAGSNFQVGPAQLAEFGSVCHRNFADSTSRLSTQVLSYQQHPCTVVEQFHQLSHRATGVRQPRDPESLVH